MAGIQITTAHSQSENMNIYVLKCTNCEKTAVELLLLTCQHRMCQECVGECYVIKIICVQEWLGYCLVPMCTAVHNCDIHPTLSSLFYCLQLRILFEQRTLAIKHKAKDRKIVIVHVGASFYIKWLHCYLKSSSYCCDIMLLIDFR